MKKNMKILLIIITFLLPLTGYAQTTRRKNFGDSQSMLKLPGEWSIGFLGLTYPRLVNTTVSAGNSDFGYHLFLEKKLTQNISLRLKGSFVSMEGNIPGNYFSYIDGRKVPAMTETMHSNIYALGLDFVYNFLPLSYISPYLGAGAGLISIDPVYPSEISNLPSSSQASSQLNAFVGSRWKILRKWKLVTEFGYHASDKILDGINGSGKIKAFSQGYFTFAIGLQYYFSQKMFSNKQFYEGLLHHKELTLSQIRAPEISEVKPVEINYTGSKELNYSKEDLMSFRIYFGFDKSNIKQNYRFLLNQVVNALNKEPKWKLEIEGFTDNIGSSAYNLRLSKKRAISIYEYLKNKGISSGRLSIKGFGESKPASANKTKAGRAKNRRVQFNVK